MVYEDTFLADTFWKRPITLVKGRGARVWDSAGKEYIDCSCGYGVALLGHCHPKVIEAIRRQTERLLTCHGSFYNDAREECLSKLMSIKPDGTDKVFLSNSGAESTETAMKLSRKFTKKKGFIAMVNGYHGKTMGALSLTWAAKYREPFMPLLDGIKFAPYGKTEKLKTLIDGDTAAIFVEPVQGEGGINVPDDAYFPALRAWCDENNILLIVDEVQTGCGRTGKLFAYEHWGIEPDIMTLGKGIGNGVPLSAFLAKEHCAVFTPGDHGSTYGGEPLTTRVGYEVMKYIIEHDLSGRAAEKGKIVERRLNSLVDRYSNVTAVRGMGLMWAVQFSSDIGEAITKAALANGLLVNNVRPNAVRIVPPLTISDEDLEQGLAILEHIIDADAGPAK